MKKKTLFYSDNKNMKETLFYCHNKNMMSNDMGHVAERREEYDVSI